MSDTKVKGTITEKHVELVKEAFDDKVVARLKKAKEGDTFLSIVFADWIKTYVRE